jgi:hypothetical protein
MVTSYTILSISNTFSVPHNSILVIRAVTAFLSVLSFGGIVGAWTHAPPIYICDLSYHLSAGVGTDGEGLSLANEPRGVYPSVDWMAADP